MHVFILPIQALDEIVNDHFGSGDAQTQSTNDKAELQEQPRANDVDEEERVNWFRCYHTSCDNRHRILSRWFQLDY